ncbi:antibiotic biosynthesis monooxygenase [Paenibacillus sp. TRM 82003]|uniref:putative quinol monooxygenase n=1 Tax=Kineococcus sp. TRM81007 TaxID=2925831 RepID=UPI001F5A883E|nr:antibiotic biosynthesis monooxygenase family protein [Kineococcus sp. TRM81007]MCI2240317.1 antibiotic biosynthesis monooxygenase [Kineococcus sp. TRM81007]MCI3927506.1 antibiotic biosynthesis monooxygenase [Paenibacillus sp. TRM 82003]
MSITSLLDLHLKPEAVADAPAVLTETLEATRAFEGNLGVDVLRDAADEAHVLVLERWESLEADDAYRAWRATPEGASRLGELLSAPPVLTRFTTDPGI